MNNEELFEKAKNEVEKKAPKMSFPEFEDEDDLEEIPTTHTETKKPENKSFDVDFQDFSDKENEEIRLEEKDEGKVFEIESVEILKPLLVNPDGSRNEGIKLSDKPDAKVGYKTKLKVKYKNSQYVSLLPNIKWYKNVQANGTTKLMPWFAITPKKSVESDLKSNFVAEVTKLYFRFCEFKNVKPGKVSRKDFCENLVGLKVKLVTKEFEYEGTKYRIDVDSFISSN